MLRFFILALNHNACWKVGNPDGGTGFVHVLSTRAACPEGVDPQVLVFDFNLDVRVHFGQNRHGGKGRVPPFRGIKGRDSDHTVDAVFRFKVSIGIRTRHAKGDVLDPGFIAWQVIDDLNRVAF